MLAYLNDPKLKAKTVSEMAAHRKADELVKGRYWDGEKGCAVGCLSKDGKGGHDALSARLGVPPQLLHLEDVVFENLPTALSEKWPERFLKAIPVGADLSRVWPEWVVETLRDDLLPLAKSEPKCVVAIEAVIHVYEQKEIDVAAASDAARAARAAASAASAAAWAARAAASASSDASAAWAASDASAAWAARAAAWAASAARDDAWERMADRLIRLLKAAGEERSL